MITRHTSTSLSTLLRKAAASLRAPKPAAQLNARLRLALSRALHTTFTSLSTPAHALPTGNAIPARLTSYATHTAYKPFNGAFRRTTFRPNARTPRGPAIQANTGLGAARNFSTVPPSGAFAGSGATGNVPVVLRAFANIFDEDGDAALPRAARYVPYTRPSRSERRRAAGLRAPRRKNVHTRTASTASDRSAILRELGHYFPLGSIVAEDDAVPLPPTPEALVTPGTVSTLALPLAQNLSLLLAPTPTVPYADAEIGVAILARLTHGILPLHEAYRYGSNRVIPLLARLEALGVMDPLNGGPGVAVEITTDHHGNLDILRITFADRASSDILALLGDTLDVDGGMWWAMSERKTARPLTETEESQIMEVWDDAPRPAASRHSTASSVHELIMPTLDLSMVPTVVPSSASDASWPPSPALSAASFPNSSGTSTPASFDHLELHSSWTSSPSNPASLLSSIADSFSDVSDDGWSVSPSDEDQDVASAWADDSDTDSAEVEDVIAASWETRGFGLMQPW
ncbi:uncharacterized protein LOC62_02G003040 [Vanrija pseudolonga]|uniref:Uncharacterized protein n=1 Tax=Vanrija pseudolonga TaxID=143232 RepID=A0AAF0Y3A1_9TREE|nr:hypothetical protein LOC62_02G003040 [Vanrija pseudolonga]